MKKVIGNGKIRIVHLLAALGGAGKELGILKLIDHLDNERFDSSLVVTSQIYEDRLPPLDDYDIIHLDVGSGNHPDLPFKLARIFRQHRFDIIHTHSWGTLVEGIVGAKLARSPVIVHGEHGTFPTRFPHTLIQRFFWDRADKVLSVSDVLGKKLSEITKFDNHKIQVILNGVDDTAFFPSPQLRRKFRERFEFREDDFVVGTVGRFNRVKNHPMIVRGLVPLAQSGEPVEFSLVGGGLLADTLGEELRGLARDLGVSDRVHFVGFQHEMNMAYNGFDVFTLTSFSEGCSNVIQEAMFAGKPVIATNVGGNPELVVDGLNGFLVESDNSRQWTEAVRALKNDPALLRRMGEQACQYARENFSLKKMVRAYEAVYLEAYHRNVRR